MELCPECAHILYGYQNCPHHFQNGRCVNCYWDGSKSEYIKYFCLLYTSLLDKFLVFTDRKGKTSLETMLKRWYTALEKMYRSQTAG